MFKNKNKNNNNVIAIFNLTKMIMTNLYIKYIECIRKEIYRAINCLLNEHNLFRFLGMKV